MTGLPTWPALSPLLLERGCYCSVPRPLLESKYNHTHLANKHKTLDFGYLSQFFRVLCRLEANTSAAEPEYGSMATQQNAQPER